MPTVGFLTSHELRALTADDRLAVPRLEALGIRVEPLVWTDESADPTRFDLVVVRSTWDWFRDAARFRASLEALASRVRLLNERAWSWLDKRYLLGLAERGARVLPMNVVRDAGELDRALGQLSGTAVLKPATAAGGHRVERFDVADHAAAHRALATILAADVALLQPYFSEVERDGEWSLFFFEGRFSHAIRKRPRAGDFRVHEEYGGTFEAAVPPAEMVATAERALAAADQETLYARVDGIVVPSFGGFCVSELELVEPELCLRMDPGAPARFAEAIARTLKA